MPFKSKAQRRWMYAKEPKMAARWSKKTPKGAKLPEKVSHGLAHFLKLLKERFQ